MNIYMWCKIFDDVFPDCPWEESDDVTEEQVFNFLMSDVECQRNEGENTIPGDLVIWYLGCNEKFGTIQYKGKSWDWSFGESTFSRVREAIDYMYKDGFFSKVHYLKLIEVIEEGEKIDNMYEIGNYLTAKSEGRAWLKPADFRESSKQFFGNVIQSLEENGFKILA